MSCFALAGVMVPALISGMELSGGVQSRAASLDALLGVQCCHHSSVAAPRTGSKAASPWHRAQVLPREEEQEGGSRCRCLGRAPGFQGRQWAQGIFH